MNVSCANICATNNIPCLKEVSPLSVTCAKEIILRDALHILKSKSIFGCACAIILFSVILHEKNNSM